MVEAQLQTSLTTFKSLSLDFCPPWALSSHYWLCICSFGQNKLLANKVGNDSLLLWINWVHFLRISSGLRCWRGAECKAKSTWQLDMEMEEGKWKFASEIVSRNMKRKRANAPGSLLSLPSHALVETETSVNTRTWGNEDEEQRQRQHKHVGQTTCNLCIREIHLHFP